MSNVIRLAAAAAIGAALVAPLHAADFTPSRTAAEKAPPSFSAGQTPQRILMRRYTARPTSQKVGVLAQGMFCGNEREVRFTEEVAKVVLRDLPATVRRELAAAGYPSVSESMFGPNVADAGEPPEYELAAALVDLEMRACASGNEVEGGIWMQLRWELFAPRERRVVYSAVTEGSGVATSQARKPLIDLQHKAIAAAARNLLADPRFVEHATRRAQGAAAAQQAALPIARRATGTQPIADNMTLLQSAVVTLFSGIGSGSGFYISGDGWLLTNQHVVGDAKFVKVKLANGRELVGEVMRSAAARDVALVKTETVSLVPFDVAGSEGQAGDDVYVLGSPLGESLAYTVTRGVLSAAREVDKQRWLQSDARILPGSSGGPLVGKTGAVLGITSRGIAAGAAGVNLFVPIADALSALNVEFRSDK